MRKSTVVVLAAVGAVVLLIAAFAVFVAVSL